MVRFGWPGWCLLLAVVGGVPAVAQEPAPPPERVELNENYPNPFYPATTIPFVIHPEVCGRGHQPLVSLKIYNVLVQVVAVPVLVGASGERVDGIHLPCGEYQAYWDGKLLNAKGEVTPGVYYYQLTVDGQRFTRKMIVRM